MRVISGFAKGRTLKAVPGMGTRPTTDKVKEAIFSVIGPYFDGGMALDLFGGTGGLGIEALSRGMDQAVFIDADRKSIDIIQQNVRALQLEGRAEIYRNDAFRALKALGKRNLQFDLIFLDPPYRLEIIADLLAELTQASLARPGAIAVCEYDSGVTYAEVIGGFRSFRQAVYGETAVSYYRYDASNEPEQRQEQGEGTPYDE